MTISELQKKMSKEKNTKENRNEYLDTFVKQLDKKHIGYFNGKKVPFNKNMSYKQCIFNPYKDDSSLITVQIVGKGFDQPGESEADKQVDNLTRKMTEYARATQYLQIKKLVNDKDLFTKGSDDTVLQNFGKLGSSDRMIQRSQMSHYALISFWKMNQQSRQEVMHTYFVEYPLSRDINLSKGLSEVLFLANNIKLPFLFSYVDEQKTSF